MPRKSGNVLSKRGQGQGWQWQQCHRWLCGAMVVHLRDHLVCRQRDRDDSQRKARRER